MNGKRDAVLIAVVTSGQGAWVKKANQRVCWMMSPLIKPDLNAVYILRKACMDNTCWLALYWWLCSCDHDQLSSFDVGHRSASLESAHSTV